MTLEEEIEEEKKILDEYIAEQVKKYGTNDLNTQKIMKQSRKVDKLMNELYERSSI